MKYICEIEIHIFKGFNFLRDILHYIRGLKPQLFSFQLTEGGLNEVLIPWW